MATQRFNLRKLRRACIHSRTRGEEDGESDESVGMRAARIRSNIADVYGVICGELASPSSGLNSAISGKENSLIKLGQLFRSFLSLFLFSIYLPPSFFHAPSLSTDHPRHVGGGCRTAREWRDGG